ncbi:MAG: Ig-like domain-containing protein, partial [Chloroflexi bacterium]|nr:Ig-like domain-containing protein [Chloroflexota bacterium]
VVATGTAGADGTYLFSVQLPPGTHEVSVRSTHPDTGEVALSRAFTVFVPAPRPTALALAPAAASIPVGATVRFIATETFSNGTSADVTARATLESVNPSVATIASDGTATGLAPGTTTIRARADGFVAEATLTVSAPALAASSPEDGEGDVAVTRETILRFTAPLDAATVTPDAIFARFAGATLGSRLHISPDRKTVTVFYASPLPASARVRVTVDGDRLRAETGSLVDADRDGIAGGTGTIDFDTLSLTVVQGTSVCGRVFASELAPGGVGSVNVPLEGVTITVDGLESLRTTTDDMGHFRLEPAPAGRFFVHVDGRTATNGVPPGTYYPFVGKAWESAPGRETVVGEVHLPLVPAGTLRPVSETEPTTITFVPEMLAQFPHLEGVEITVPADSLYHDDGTRGGQVGIAPVPPDRLPGQ